MSKTLKTIRFGVTGKLALAFGAMMIVSSLAAAITYGTSDRLGNSINANAELRTGMKGLESYEQAFRSATASLRSFLLTSDRTFVSRFEEAVSRRSERLKALQETKIISAELLDAGEAAAKRWETEFARHQIALMRDPSTVDLARAIEVTGKPQLALDEVELKLAAAHSSIAKKITAAVKVQAASLDQLRLVALGSGAVGFILTLIFAMMAYRMIARPMGELASATQSLADGNLDTEIGHTARSDEIGGVSRALLVFRDGLARTKALEEEAKKSDEKRRVDRRKELAQLADEFEGSIKGVVQLVGSAADKLSTSAQSLSAIAEETSAQAIAVSDASTEAASNVDNVATAAEQLSASIGEIGGQIANNSDLVSQAAGDAESTSSTVTELGEVVKRVSEVTGLISDIAEQTNLLALNATIEAARAGEAGKGFAVVAGEVKSLASQTGRATEQIDTQIAEMQTKSATATSAVGTIGSRLSEMQKTAASIAAAVEQQSQATQEIARSVQQAAVGTKAVTDNIETVRSAATETGRMSNEVQSEADELSKHAAALNEQVDAFVNKVRAA